MEELDNIVVLTDETGEETKFEFLDLVEYQGEEYVVLLPADTSDDEIEEVIILLVEYSDDSDIESYVGVEDEDTLNAVFELFKEKFNEENDFTD